MKVLRAITSVFSAILLTLPPAVFSATAVCTGPIHAVSNHVPGGVYVRVADSDIMRICVPGAMSFRTNAENCKHYLAIAMLAVATGKAVTIYVDNAPTTACASITAWHDADVRYFHIVR